MIFSAQPTDYCTAPIVALHSSASNSGQWTRLEAEVEGRFDIFAYDLPGYGRAPLTRDDQRQGAACSAAPVICEIEKIGCPVHLVGHSNGGGIAIKVALMRPELVKSLTLYEPATFHFLKDGSSTDQRLFRQIRRISEVLAETAADNNAPAGMQHFLDFWNGEGFWERLPVAARQKFTDAMASTMADFAHGFAETWDLADLVKLEMPTLVMTGLESPEITQHVAIAIAKALPNARIALLPELGHLAPIFQPEWVNSRIFEHVAHAERPAPTCSWPSQAAA